MRYKARRRRDASRIKNKHKRIAKYGKLSPYYQVNKDENGKINYVEDEDSYIKYSGRGKSSRYLKKRTNHKLRKEEDIYNRGEYRKIHDFWWDLT